MVHIGHQSLHESTVLVHQPSASLAPPQQFMLDLSSLPPNTQWMVLLLFTVVVCVAVAIMLTRKREASEIVIKGSDLRARESMKILSRGVNYLEGKMGDLAVEEVRILPFGERFYNRDRINDAPDDGTPKSSFAGTTVIGDRTFQKAIRDEAVSIRSFKASEQSFLDRQLNMSGRNSFIIEPRQKANSKSNRSQNYSTMADEDEEEIKNFLDNLDVSFELDYHPELSKSDSVPKQSSKREC